MQYYFAYNIIKASYLSDTPGTERRKEWHRFMIANKIKMLRERHNLTQSDLAKKLGLTRSGVNAWEMGISVPSTQYIVELAALFGVSTDYLLDIEKEKSININGLSEKEVGMIIELVEYFKQNKQK